MPDFKKIGIPLLLSAVGVAVAIVLYSVLMVPGGKSPEQVAQEKPPELQAPNSEISSVTQLQINRLEQNLQSSEENIQKMFKNQEELNKAITQQNVQLANNVKTMKDQRAYIAMIYEKMLELELKTESLGGGLSGASRKPYTPVAPNPLQGMDSLPATPYNDGVLPPLDR